MTTFCFDSRVARSLTQPLFVAFHKIKRQLPANGNVILNYVDLNLRVGSATIEPPGAYRHTHNWHLYFYHFYSLFGEKLFPFCRCCWCCGDGRIEHSLVNRIREIVSSREILFSRVFCDVRPWIVGVCRWKWQQFSERERVKAKKVTLSRLEFLSNSCSRSIQFYVAFHFRCDWRLSWSQLPLHIEERASPSFHATLIRSHIRHLHSFLFIQFQTLILPVSLSSRQHSNEIFSARRRDEMPFRQAKQASMSERPFQFE